MNAERTLLSLLFESLRISSPYKWQREAFRHLCEGEPPSQIKVPTAAGKTMIVPIFVAALATQAATGRVTLPRRLVYVVNRRVLVDDVSGLAERILCAINEEALRPVRDALAGLSVHGQALAVSTLRGQLEDNGEWSLDPSTPAIIMATPDMLGSRLLFRGYGVGRSRSATHAGHLGCDTLVVHDEAHLAPAFTSLLRQIEAFAEPGAKRIGRPPLRVIEMTATLSSSFGQPLVCDISTDPALAARMSARKQFKIIDASPVAGRSANPIDAVVDTIADLAATQRDENRAIAIFVSSPASADKIANRLQSAGVDPDRITTLTGTMRGHERATLLCTPAFKRCDPGPDRTSDGTAYFIATSAGEIGLDIDADAGLFDLTTLDRFIQRGGRINRRGQGLGQIILVHASGQELPEEIRQRGLTALRLLDGVMGPDDIGDVSPLALNRLCDLPDYTDAIEPAPAIRVLEPAIVDMLSMTSLQLDELGCPSPDVFIHGLVEANAELGLAWRDLPSAGADFAEWLDVWPIAPREIARLPIDAARRFLSERLSAAGTDYGQVLAVALSAQGLPIAEDARLMPGARVDRWIRRLRPGSIVLLSKAVGGLTGQGIPSATSVGPAPDVSFGFTDANGMYRQAIRQLTITVHRDDEGALWRHEALTAPSLETVLQGAVGALEIVYHDGPRVFEGTDWSGTVSVWLSDRAVRTADSGDFASLGPRDRLLDEHLDLTARAARRLCASLGMSPELEAAEIRSGAQHDKGKQWERWQRAIGNVDPTRPLGKSATAAFDFKINDGFRHELGSLVDSGVSLTLLERHLVVSHHGWCRPGFRDAALAKPGCARVAQAAGDGYAVLHSAIGPWALCYLEAVLKSADAFAEILDVSLAADPAVALLDAIEWPTISRMSAEAFRLPVDISNFGEYLAALGVASLATRGNVDVRLGWADGCFVLRGVGSEAVLAMLQSLRDAKVSPDERATVKAQRGAQYPPLRLALNTGEEIALNHWLDERLQGASRWKLGAGRTAAARTLASVAKACSDSLDLADFDPAAILAIGGARVGADASKLRFDAATNWSARDAGFSLNENERFKSTRPWVELLSALGLQYFFPPPADSLTAYFTWQGELPPALALAAVKGLLPQCDAVYKIVIEPTGKATKDVFTSHRLFTERRRPCPALIQVI